ncbi:NAD(P)H-quinone oxidoreductase [Rhodohalobacter sp. 8-1]|uniref:NAD(P)H-quinone oxidoreductase n=1 Tax=Rhodohalobacter sp. 8-1 TaxID=3131972 RepID=UPI0030EDDD75
MKALIVDNASGTPVMVPGTHDKPEPGPNELLVKIEATALNRADLLQKAGNYPIPENASPILGLEMSGTVEKAGTETRRFKPGDYIMGLLPGGGYAEYCVIRDDHAMAKPEALSFEEAAAIPEVFLTAFQGLFWIGELYDDETVLIHAGASGVGTAAIQLAKQVSGTTIITTAGTEAKLDLCRHLGAGLALNYKEENFDEAIERQFGDSAVDVILDFVGASYWHQNMEVLAMDGRLVHLGLLGGASVDSVNLGTILRKRLTVRGSTLRNRSDEYKALLTEEFTDRFAGLFDDGTLRPVIDSIYEWEEAEEAHQRMKHNENAGKIVLNGM